MEQDTSSNIICRNYEPGVLCKCVRRYYTFTDNIGSYIDISSVWITETMDFSSNIIINNKTFLSIYTTMEQQVQQNESVIFDSSSANMGDCLFIPNTPDIWIFTPGFYQIYTNIYHLEACQLGLYKNGIVIENSVIGSLSGSSQNTSCIIIEIMESDILNNGCNLQLINNTAYLPYITIIGSPSSGNNIPQVSASLSILKIM
jgi:hypothetical protein